MSHTIKIFGLVLSLAMAIPSLAQAGESKTTCQTIANALKKPLASQQAGQEQKKDRVVRTSDKTSTQVAR